VTWTGRTSTADATASVALGTVQWGQQYGIANQTGPPPAREVAAILDHAAAAGIRVLDTARTYGRSEEVIGTLLSLRPEVWQVVTKLTSDLGSGDANGAVRMAAASLQQSRRALRRERIDILLLHRAAHRDAAGGAVWAFLREERAAGRIGALGISASDPTEASEALTDPEIEVLQVATSLLDQRLVRARFFDRALEKGLRVFVRSVLLQGAATLAADELPPHLATLSSIIDGIRAWSATRGVPSLAPYLAFVSRLGPVEVLLGCERLLQLDANLRAWSAGVSLQDIDELATSIPDMPDALLDPSQWPR
jgi:aryl-alcohol dehydrogenase-like predicted oxidoreductase